MTPTNLATSLLAVSNRVKGATDPGKMDELQAELLRLGLKDEAEQVQQAKWVIWHLAEEFADLREAVRTKFNIQEKDDG